MVIRLITLILVAFSLHFEMDFENKTIEELNEFMEKTSNKIDELHPKLNEMKKYFDECIKHSSKKIKKEIEQTLTDRVKTYFESNDKGIIAIPYIESVMNLRLEIKFAKEIIKNNKNEDEHKQKTILFVVPDEYDLYKCCQNINEYFGYHCKVYLIDHKDAFDIDNDNDTSESS